LLDLNADHREWLLFATKEEIFRFNFETEQEEVIFTFPTQLSQQPSYFFPNTNRTVFVVGMEHDVKMIRLKDKMD